MYVYVCVYTYKGTQLWSKDYKKSHYDLKETELYAQALLKKNPRKRQWRPVGL
jgi:hypothetical protein